MMRLIRKPVVFCTITIFINLAIFIFVKYQLQSTSVNLTYRIFDINMKEGSLFVQLDIQKVDTNKLILDSGLPAEFQALEIHSVLDAVGKTIKYSYVEDKVEKREDISYSASKLVIPLERRQKFARIVYQVRVGRENPPPDPAVKGVRTTLGSISEDFGLFYGSNVFLLPRTEIEQVKVQIKPPEGWNIVSTLQKSEKVGEFRLTSERPKQAIFGAVIGLGKFTEYTKQMGQTLVKIYVNKGYAPHESEIANTTFSIFQSIIDLFGASVEQYTCIFAPAGQEGDNVWITSNSMGLGASLTMPPSEMQWLDVAKNIFYKWSKYSANSLSYAQQDKWFTEGVSIYSSVQILSKLDLLNKDRCMLRFYSKYYSMYPYKQVLRNNFYRSKPEVYVDLMNLPELYKSTYWTTDNSMRETVEVKSVVFAAYLDNWIRKQSQGKYNLNDIIKQKYNPQAKSQSLIGDIQQVTNLDASECFAYAGGEAAPILYKDIRELGELDKKPQHGKKDIDAAKLGHTLKPTRADTSAHWKKERTLTFLISSNTHAYLETCGCLASQSGGVARMATVVRKERQKNPNLVLFSAGNAFPDRVLKEQIDQLELNAFLDSFEMMGYEFAAVSELELLYGYSALKEHSETLSFPFICANIYAGNNSIFKPYVLKKMGNYKVGFLGLSQEVYASGLTSMYQSKTAHLLINNPIEIIDRYLPILRKTCDLVVLVGRLDVAMITEILDHTDQIDLIITPLGLSRWSVNSSGEVYFGRSANGFLGDTLIWVCAGQTYALDKLELNMSASGKIQDFRHSDLKLSESVEDASDIRHYLNEFYSKIAENDEVGFDKPILSWERTTAEFVGVEMCKSCHLDEYNQWSQTKHASAYNTLLRKHRQFSPKCVMCHVTGGGYDSGYTFGSPDRSLVNVQCEMCHGPGSAHVKAPLQVNMLRRPPEKLCVACHDEEHSDFNMKKYYPKVRH